MEICDPKFCWHACQDVWHDILLAYMSTCVILVMDMLTCITLDTYMLTCVILLTCMSTCIHPVIANTYMSASIIFYLTHLHIDLHNPNLFTYKMHMMQSCWPEMENFFKLEICIKPYNFFAVSARSLSLNMDHPCSKILIIMSILKLFARKSMHAKAKRSGVLICWFSFQVLMKASHINDCCNIFIFLLFSELFVTKTHLCLSVTQQNFPP